jgi:hypothetical protein
MKNGLNIRKNLSLTANRYFILPTNILSSISFGLNVNFAINKMIKRSILFAGILLVGCAAQPTYQTSYQPADITNFVANCSDAKRQIDFLNVKIDEYNRYHQNNTPTLEDRRYYSKLKNNLWSLRSTCSVKYL